MNCVARCSAVFFAHRTVLLVMAAVLGALKACGWPVRNVFNMISADPKGDGQPRNVNGDFSGGRLRPVHNQLSDYVAVQASSLPKIGE